MTPDPRWLEILKASGWQTIAIASGCGIFLYLAHAHVLPPLPDAVTWMVWFGCLICSMLALTSLLSWALMFFNVRALIIAAAARRQGRRELIAYIPHMTPTERAIIAYMLAHKQTTFTTNQDGGNAMTLISRRIIVPALQPGQVFTAAKCPFVLPDHLWEILVSHADQFPTEVAPDEPNPKPPWHIHWMNR